MPEKFIQRTDQQNKALHKYYDLTAEELNNKQLDVFKVLGEGIEVPWTEDLVKEAINSLGLDENLSKEELELIARYFNDNLTAMPTKLIFNKNLPLYWTPARVKEYLWRPLQIKMFKIESTTELNTSQITQIWEVLNLTFSENFGIYIPFPSEKEK